MGSKVSPLAPARFPDLPVIGGVRFASAAAGVRYKGRTDVMLAVMDDAVVAGTFTRSSTRSAAVRDCQDKLDYAEGGGAAFLVNSGNSNAFTGRLGEEAVDGICNAAAQALGLPASRVFTSSTGVIGEPLPWQRITDALPALLDALDPQGIEAAAQAIMTTDTFPKGASAEVELSGGVVRIAGSPKAPA